MSSSPKMVSSMDLIGKKILGIYDFKTPLILFNLLSLRPGLSFELYLSSIYFGLCTVLSAEDTTENTANKITSVMA
jgi:hypothetical protein